MNTRETKLAATTISAAFANDRTDANHQLSPLKMLALRLANHADATNAPQCALGWRKMIASATAFASQTAAIRSLPRVRAIPVQASANIANASNTMVASKCRRVAAVIRIGNPDPTMG